MIERYRARLLEALAAAEAGGSHRAVLAAYLEPFAAFVEGGDKVCLCGALAGEFAALPKPMQPGDTLLLELRAQGDRLVGLVDRAAVIDVRDRRSRNGSQ